MKKTVKYLIGMGCILLFSRCSWVEYFVIANKSDKAIYISYQLDQTVSSFPIFYDHPSIHKLENGTIDWTSNMNIKDDYDNLFEVNMAIPPHCALVFGGLHNDKYTSYSQHFINGRVFNLQRLDITAYTKTLTILPNTFDQYFKKHRGQIHFVII